MISRVQKTTVFLVSWLGFVPGKCCHIVEEFFQTRTASLPEPVRGRSQLAQEMVRGRQSVSRRSDQGKSTYSLWAQLSRCAPTWNPRPETKTAAKGIKGAADAADGVSQQPAGHTTLYALQTWRAPNREGDEI
jgi:hypothetical protein